MSKTINMSSKKVRTKESDEPKFHFFRLNPVSERGKLFMDVMMQGIAADRAADEFAKKLGAVEFLTNGSVDFGGCIAFIFPKEKEIDREVFTLVKGVHRDGDVWQIDVKLTNTLVLWENMPADNDRIIKIPESRGVDKVAMHFTREQIAQAVGMELQYMHPARILEFLGFSREQIISYLNGGTPMKDLLEKVNTNNLSGNRRKIFEMAPLAEQENAELIERTKGKQFGYYTEIDGTDKAVYLFREQCSLPVVPSGMLNSTIDIRGVKGHCDFFLHKNWIYIRTKGKVESEINDDLQVTTFKDWEESREEEMRRQGGRKEK